MYLGLGLLKVRGVCAKRTTMLAYLSLIVKDSRVLSVIRGALVQLTCARETTEATSRTATARTGPTAADQRRRARLPPHCKLKGGASARQDDESFEPGPRTCGRGARAAAREGRGGADWIYYQLLTDTHNVAPFLLGLFRSFPVVLRWMRGLPGFWACGGNSPANFA